MAKQRLEIDPYETDITWGKDHPEMKKDEKKEDKKQEPDYQDPRFIYDLKNGDNTFQP